MNDFVASSPSTQAAVSSAPTERILRFFGYKHLPLHLQEVSRPFAQLAATMVETLPFSPERSAGLRKLLEAKDCAVRASLERDSP